MKNPFVVLAVVIALSSGCAVTRITLPREGPTFTIGKLKGVPSAHAQTVLFVNRSGAEQECLVFRGRYNIDQLFHPGSDGLPDLSVIPVGYFKVEMPNTTPATETLVGYFEPQQDYTVLCVAEDMLGYVLDMSVVPARIRGRTVPTKYRYKSTLGYQMEKFVNEVVYLPSYRSRRNVSMLANTQVNLNVLVAKLFHALGLGVHGKTTAPMIIRMERDFLYHH